MHAKRRGIKRTYRSATPGHRHARECRNQSLKGAQTRRVNIEAASFLGSALCRALLPLDLFNQTRASALIVARMRATFVFHSPRVAILLLRPTSPRENAFSEKNFRNFQRISLDEFQVTDSSR